MERLEREGLKMKNELQALLDRLEDAQREMIQQAARTAALPSDNTLRKIADLEVAIGAVSALLEGED